MPAYRSAAEAEIRDAVVAHLRRIRPEARIIHEIQNACQGPNRLDLIAVSRSEIIAVEIKSAKDKIDRLPAQIEAMRGCAHRAIAALHEKFLVPVAEKELQWLRDDLRQRRDPPVEARGAELWVHPVVLDDTKRHWTCQAWSQPEPAIMAVLPPGSLDMLWANELRDLCHMLGLKIARNATRHSAMSLIRWQANGAEITKGICSLLRRRRCLEADPEIEDAA